MNTVVYQESRNNFMDADQAINSRQIVSAIYGPNDPETAGIHPSRVGEVYIQIPEGSASGKLRMWVAIAQHGAGAIWSEVVGTSGTPENVAVLDRENDFEDSRQRILGSQIMSAKPFTGSFPSKSPDYEGQMAICRNTDDTMVLFMSYKDNTDILVWRELHDGALPDTIVETDKVNNFTEPMQTIAGRRIQTFINGNGLNPGESSIRPEYDGQLYIAFKTLSTGPDVAVWVAYGPNWVPIVKEAVDASKYARVDETNVFENPLQLLGKAEDTRMIGGTRIKRGALAPVADASWKAVVEGEQTIFINNNTNPVEYSIWTAVKVNPTPSNVGEWVMTWSSKGTGGGSVGDNVAKVDEINQFVPLQRIGVGENYATISTSRAGLLNPYAHKILPYSDGEVYVQEMPSTNNFKIWMATAEGDTDSWICIHDTDTGNLIDRITNLETFDDAVTDRMSLLDADMDRLAETVGSFDADITAVESDLALIEDKTVNLDTRLGNAELRIEALETGAPPPSGTETGPSKWFILPIAGQSNAVGFGEIVPKPEDPHPRIKQLAVYDSPMTKGTDRWQYEVDPDCSGYGARYREFRPMEDSNLKLIPSAPCIDSSQNMMYAMHYDVGGDYAGHAGGTVSPAHYIAKSLLPYIPDDYGIAIVCYAFGGTGFETTNNNYDGTYDPVTKRAFAGVVGGEFKWSNNWSWGKPLSQAFYDRVKHALELNAENKMLPVLWFQGENDSWSQQHEVGYKGLVKGFKDQLVTDGLDGRIPSGKIRDFRWVNVGFVSGFINPDENYHSTNYLDNKFNFKLSHLGSYDNYAYLMDDPEFQDPITGESQIISLRADIDLHGDLFETTDQESTDHGLSNIMGRDAHLHWSSNTLRTSLPSIIVNAVGKYGRCLEGVPYTRSTRHIVGRKAKVSTDNVRFEYDNTPDQSFDVSNSNKDLVISRVYRSDVEVKGSGVTKDHDATDKVDTSFGKVGDLSASGSSSGIVYTTPAYKSWTVSFIASLPAATRDQDAVVFNTTAEYGPRFHKNQYGVLAIYPRYKQADAESHKINLPISKHMFGAWKGIWEDYQQFTFTYDAQSKMFGVYVNGCLIETFNNLESTELEGITFPAASKAGIASIRVYDRAISCGEVNSLQSALFDAKAVAIDETIVVTPPDPETPSSKNPTKWYVLPIGGQSNALGMCLGPQKWHVPTEPNPRIMQLGVCDSVKHPVGTEDQWNISLETSGMTEELYDIYRPMEDTNLKLIPAAPAMDSANNMHYYWANNTYDGKASENGGMMGVGLHLAESILKHLPHDYGIVVVQASGRGSFFTEVDYPTRDSYDAVNMRPEIIESNLQGVDSGFGNMMYDRVKVVLDMHPENRLLPVIWMQGESDTRPAGHSTKFEEYVKWFNGKLDTDGFETRLPCRDLAQYKWFCFGTTKCMFDDFTNNLDYLNQEIDYTHIPDWFTPSTYDNYPYLSDKADFRNPITKERNLIYVRFDVDEDGNFFEIQDHNEAHFDENTIMFRQPEIITSLLSKYGKCLNGAGGTGLTHTRPIRGGFGTVTTDFVNFIYDNAVDPTFDESYGLKYKRDFTAGTIFKAEGVTATGEETITTAEDTELGNVGVLDGTADKTQTVELGLGNNDYTISIMSKFDIRDREASLSILSGGDTGHTPRLGMLVGAPLFYTSYNATTTTKNKRNIRIQRSIFGAWGGQFDDWQHYTFVYQKSVKAVHIYLNGCLIESIVGVDDSTLNQLVLGVSSGDVHSRGKIASVRVYGHCLNTKEVNSLTKIVKGEWTGEASPSQVTMLESKVATLEALIQGLQEQLDSITPV